MYLFCLFFGFISSYRRGHKRHRADRFSSPSDSAQFSGTQPLGRAKRLGLKGSSWGHGYVCAGGDGPATESWEWTLSHYHGCTVSICCQMMSCATTAQTWVIHPGVEKTPTSSIVKVQISHLHLCPFFFPLLNPPAEPTCCSLELSSSLLVMDWDIWESFLFTLP